jgi:hypothetical protein
MPLQIRAGEGVPILQATPALAAVAGATEGFTFAFDAAPQAKPPLAVSWFKQVVTEWCWAATAQMVLRFYGFKVKQCDIANVRFDDDQCCSFVGPSDRNKACKAADVALIYNGFNLGAKFQEGPVDFDKLNTELNTENQRRPVEVGIEWNGGGKHLVVIYGCEINQAGEQLLHISDPLPQYKQGQVLYDELKGAYQSSGKWICTWTEIA